MQEGKKVRGVVISKQGKSIFCLLPDEEMLKYDLDFDYREFLPQQLVEGTHMKGVKQVPCLGLLQATHYFINEINKNLEAAEQPKLAGTYWSWFDDRPYFMYSPVMGKKYLIGEGASAKVRFVLKLTLK